jgi:uncharacterized membrane protein YebE (DUF533 family)
VDALAAGEATALPEALGADDNLTDLFGDTFEGGFGGVLDRLSDGAGGDGDGGTLALAGLVGGLGLAGGALAATTSLGDILSGHIDAGRPSPEEEARAKLLLRAMIEAAKSDGALDMREKQRILGTLGDASPGEVSFVTAQMQAPADPEGLARDTPEGMAREVYAAALMAARQHVPAEARFLARLGQALELTAAEIDSLHRRRRAA